LNHLLWNLGRIFACALQTASTAPALEEPKDQDDERYDHQNVNHAAECVRGKQPEQPQNQKNYSYCPKHYQSTSFNDSAD